MMAGVLEPEGDMREEAWAFLAAEEVCHGRFASF